MKTYIGTKIIKAMPMTRLAYNCLRGWDVPLNENPDDAGHLVEYTDGGKPNVPGYEGYVSWSPAEQFENAYRPCSAMTFGLAIEALKAGKRVARAGWNGKGMWLAMVGDGHYDVGIKTVGECALLPWIGMKTADGKFVPWLASQTDVLAEDWQIVAD